MTSVDGASAPRRLRVLYLSWRDRENPEAGGSETFVERTAELLSERGHDLTLFTSRFPGAPVHDRHGDVRVVRHGGRFTVYLRGLLHVWRHHRQYDVVIDVQNGVPFWSPLVTRVPVLLLVHHVHQKQWRAIFGPRLAGFGWWLESRAAPRVYRRHRYVTVSESTRTELGGLGVDAERVSLVYSGNDRPDNLAKYAALPRSPNASLIVLGRLVPHKQVELAIDLLPALASGHPDLVLHVVGSGYWRTELEQHAERLGVADRVVFHGFVDDDTKHRLLAQSWLMVMPSQKEGWGLTIVEAGTHAVPAVAFRDSGGPTESIVSGATGLLAESFEDMVGQVSGLLADDDLRKKYGANALEHASTFSWSTSAEQLERTLLEVTGA